ncbi:hypothetical protein FNV43_RR08333 [Rhamnella rubrinervis]|uniref:NADH:quinone oxidoreductase/Mrp antiporter transmembrane domain-containing protein n=1 Tax=Rhamnella rubrinervis TaxID=2594499 RepID=A0A8K0HIA0_9ROSA|nr:hypothetical protein FNV43_RR08333 [Rhamnella rubrinervis]
MIAGLSPRSARWPIGIAAFGLCLPFLIKNSGSARESAGNNRKEGVHVAAAPAPFLVNGAAGALAAMAQTKVKRPLAHSSIGHVGYIRTGFSCGTIEGIQSLLIGIFIYASMTIDAFAIVSALRQTRVKYIADLGALAKTNPISAITFSITMFSYAGIPPLAGFCSKFYLFFAALGCGAYFLAPVGVVTSVIGRWAAGRLPRVSKFGDRRQFSVHRTRSLSNPVATRMGMHATEDRVESDTSTVYSISLLV